MQAKARIKYLRMSPKKMRRVADLVKGKPVEEALNILNFTPKAAAHPLAKTVKSAAANAISAVGTAKLRAEDLSITNIMVDSAPTAKRVRFQSMGRVFRLRKRFCHLTVEVEGEPQPDEPKTRGRRKKKADTEEVAPPAKKKTAAKAKSKVKDEAKSEVEEKQAKNTQETEDKLEEPKVKADTKVEPKADAVESDSKTTDDADKGDAKTDDKEADK